ncbi:LTA synthase family protein [Liberibacter crescens]|uniref:LTA synthase family protein n=1 Tax=Liberibacter crescens TaxID=1273132 RepID=UPI0002E4728B|nr:LTA synthase family protein [Liberibacter crescens]
MKRREFLLNSSLFAATTLLNSMVAPVAYGSSDVTKETKISQSDRTPDIIAIMNESLWDPNRLSGITLTPDPMEFIRSNLSGYVFSPEFGGMTANVEFEFLTSFSNAFLPYGNVPYQNIRSPIPSLADFFRKQGYKVEAFHPYEGWFWNRSEVYKNFGFEKFLSKEILPPLEKHGVFASDEAFIKVIMNEADHSTDKPVFFFAVTLQGHGPYSPHRYPYERISILGLPEKEKEILSSYIEGVYEADKSFEMLINWAKKRKRDTIIVLFGDHLPPLSSVYVVSGYMKTPVAQRKAPFEIMKKEHETPLVLWSSWGGSVQLNTLSPSLLSYYILKLAGYEHPYYTEFLGKIVNNYSVIDRNVLLSSHNEETSSWIKRKIPPIISSWQLLQYDLMFGKQFSLEKLFANSQSIKKSG